MTQLSTIPFAGFYETSLSTIPDDIIERDAYELPEKQGQELSELCDNIVDYSKIFDDIAKQYIVEFKDYLKEECELDLPSMEFDSIESPREYNFETDRVFVKLSPDDVKKLLNACNQGDLATCIEERFTSCSGFISNYSNDVLKWIEKPLVEWDHNEIGTLFDCILFQFKKHDDVHRDLFYKLSERTSSHGDFYPYETEYHRAGTTEAQETRLNELLNLACERG